MISNKIFRSILSGKKQSLRVSLRALSTLKNTNQVTDEEIKTEIEKDS